MPVSPSSPGSGHVSVIMPVFNGALYIGEALESIRAQTAPVAEIIVVDDGSTDESARIARNFPGVTVLGKEHTGISDTLNHGLARATGEYLAFLDADDRWLPGKNEIQLAGLRADPGLDMIFGHARQFRMTPGGELMLGVQPGVCKAGGMFRMEAFRRVGGFVASMLDFMDWFARASEAGLRHSLHPEVILERRVHEANDGVLHRDAQRKTYLATLKAALDRRRSTRRGA